MSRRTDRIEDQLLQELADLVLHHLHDPRCQGCTVASVHVSPDLRQARIRVSVLGAEDRRAAAVTALTHARGHLRSELARRLRHLRRTPELHFELDRGAEYSQRISDLLEESNP